MPAEVYNTMTQDFTTLKKDYNSNYFIINHELCKVSSPYCVFSLQCSLPVKCATVTAHGSRVRKLSDGLKWMM